MDFARKASLFYRQLSLSARLPKGIEVMNPYRNPKTMSLVDAFLQKYFADSQKRVFVLGINPGRFGSGITGVTFTDPVALADFCGIPNDLPRVRELSSRFVYAFINEWGGPEKFYARFFLTAVSPLGFLCGRKNCNYYDSPALLKSLKPFITASLQEQISLGASRKTAIVFGGGKNFQFLHRLNEEHGFFQKLLPLEHPRFILQYRQRQLPRYLRKYHEVFTQALT